MLRHDAFLQFANTFPLLLGSWGMLNIISYAYKKIALRYEEEYGVSVYPKWIFTALGCIELFALFVSLYICLIDIATLIATWAYTL